MYFKIYIHILHLFLYFLVNKFNGEKSYLDLNYLYPEPYKVSIDGIKRQNIPNTKIIADKNEKHR